MMFGPRKRRLDVKGGACRRIQRKLRKEKVVLLHTIDELLLAHYEKGYNRIFEKVPQLPSVSQFDPYPPTRFT